MRSLPDQKLTARVTLRTRIHTFEYASYARRSRQVSDKCFEAIKHTNPAAIHIFQSEETLCEPDTNNLRMRLQSHFPNSLIESSDVSKTASVPVAMFDLIIVPLLGFDDTCHRLGRGGGWYDRFMSKNPQAMKIGLTFEYFKLASVPQEPHDVVLDIIVTDDNLYSSR